MQIKKIAKSNEGKRRGGGQGRAGQGVLNARSVYLYRDDYTAQERDSVSVSSESLLMSTQSTYFEAFISNTRFSGST